VEFARTIHGAGTDLLNLISDILTCRRSSPAPCPVDAEELSSPGLLDMVGRPFRHEAENRKLSFEVLLDPKLDRSIITDSKRLSRC
jgi:signal transduction histidine kinase